MDGDELISKLEARRAKVAPESVSLRYAYDDCIDIVRRHYEGRGAEGVLSRQSDECSYEAPFRIADHVDAMSEIMHICKKAMDKTVGQPWVALDKVNRLASRQLLLMKTPMRDE